MDKVVVNFIQSYNLEFEAIKPTKTDKTMTKKKRINFVDAGIGQILIITVIVYDATKNKSAGKPLAGLN